MIACDHRATCTAQAGNGESACTTAGGTLATCTATATSTCAAHGIAGTNPGDTCTADAACTYNNQGTAVTCTLPASVDAACATIGNAGASAGDDCNADATCTWDGSSACAATTAASACIAEAANGQSACTGVAGCAYDDGTSDDVCEAAVKAACIAEAANGQATCQAVGGGCTYDPPYCSYDDGTADDVCETISNSYTGDAMYMAGVSRWSAVNASYTPYDSLRTIEAEGVPMVACDDSDFMSCQLGEACSYGISSLYCSPCQPNLASDDGFQCQLCLPGQGPSVKQDACVECETGLYSSHGICIQCGRGKQPNPEQSACDNCINGTYSDTGIACEM